MAQRKTAAWMMALGALLMIMAAQPHGAAQKSTSQKPVAQKPTAQKPRAAQKPAVKPQPTTTLTGCLKMDGNQFELTNLKGSEVRMGRSWKSGFIKKEAKNVHVVAASTNLTLWDQVNRQVSVVGIRDGDTHLRASSIRRVAASCT